MNAESFINKFLIELKPYKSISQEIWTMSSDSWEHILKLDWNEATIEPSPEVRKALEKCCSKPNFLRLYPSIYNYKLIAAIAKYANVPEENVQYFSSSDSLHEYICKCYIQKDDKVLILWPSYDNFRASAESNGASIIYSEMNDNFELIVERLESDITYYSPKIVYICNPNNPTGHYIPKDIIENLIKNHQDTLFIIDEAYAEFTHQSMNDLVLLYNNLLVTHTLSKAFGLANIRFGYLVSAVDHIDIISRIRNPKNITTMTQVVAEAAFEDTDYMWKYVDEVISAREWMYEKIRESSVFKGFTVYSSESNFLLIKCPSVELKAKIYYALREKGVYIRQLNQTSSLLDCIRITIGTKEQMIRVFGLMVEILGVIAHSN